MSGIRDTTYLIDSQVVFHAWLNSFTGAPWDDYDVILGYPSSDRFKNFVNPILYVDTPEGLISDNNHFGGLGDRPCYFDLGVWLNAEHGGAEEIGVIKSAIINLFRNPSTIYSKEFTAVIGGVSYATKTLRYFDIVVNRIEGGYDIPAEKNDFRAEFQIYYNV